MATIMRDVTVNADAAGCWEAVRDFAALHERLAPGFIAGLRMTGPREREITLFTGAKATEVLIGIDEPHMRLAYSVVKSPMGSTHHNASIQTTSDGEGRCRLLWVTDVLPDDLAERTGELMDRGIDIMRVTLEEVPVGGAIS
ncbi:MAG: SRPBCC family protein [Acidimicrobiales bacterium]|nr:SRPBCC family protein [Acidimicrobiales bacterium]